MSIHPTLKSIAPVMLVIFISLLSSCTSKPPAEEATATDSVAAEGDGFVQIFDGKTLAGWEGDSTYWHVKDGSLVGEVTPTTLLKTNTFIVWQGGSPADFELKLEFKIAEAGNSGVNYRSEKVADVAHALRGYQADIDGRSNYTGQNYEERGRTTLAYRGEIASIQTQDHPEVETSFKAGINNNAWIKREILGSLGNIDSLKKDIKAGDWNSCRIVAKGNRLQHYINEILMSDVTDADSVNRKMSGLLGVQVHVGPPMTVEYRNIYLKELK